MTYPVIDPLLLRNAALSIRTMAAMMSAGAVRDSGLYYANELSKVAHRLETEPYAAAGND